MRKKPAKKKPAKTSAPKKAAKKPAKKPATKPKHAMQRADYGAAIDGYFAKQPPTTRPILEKLRDLVEEAVPDAESAIKWGMPQYSVDGHMAITLTGHKAHVNLVLWGPPSSFDDPDGKLTGEGKTGRHLKLTSVDDIDADRIRDWVRTAAAHARSA